MSEQPSDESVRPEPSISPAPAPRRRTALAAVAVLVALLAAAGVVIGLSGGKAEAPVAAAPSRTPTPVPSSPAPSPSPSDDPQTFPYVVLHTGDCFNAPGMTTTLRKLVKVDCRQPHDGQVTGREQLPAGLKDNLAIQQASLPLCKKTNDTAYFAQGHNSPLHEAAYFPETALYRSGRHTVTCALEIAFRAPKLTAPLK